MTLRQVRKSVLALSASTALWALSGPAMAQASSLDQQGWYASGALAAAVSVRGSGPDVTLFGARPLALQGSTEYGDGYSLGLAVGKQMRSDRDKNEPTHYRIEGEYWYANLDRDTVRLGQLVNATNDSVRAHALFVNGLVRFGTTENSRWWAGLGLGYANVKVPAAGAQLAGCNCLGADTASGLAWRLKVQGERAVSKDSSVFLELGYVRLPSGSVANASSETRYGGISVGQVGVGLRTRF